MVRLVSRLKPSSPCRPALCLLVMIMVCPTLTPWVTTSVMWVILWPSSLSASGAPLSLVKSLGLVTMVRPMILL